MADDKIAELRTNLMDKGLLGTFEDNVQINHQGNAIPYSQRQRQESGEEKKEKRENRGDYDISDSCSVS